MDWIDDGEGEIPEIHENPEETYCDRYECALRKECYPYRALVGDETLDYWTYIDKLIKGLAKLTSNKKLVPLILVPPPYSEL